jgi:2-desacetyl-2-hydroxyethyl bacteriochlorophyllide A dehydrogenase
VISRALFFDGPRQVSVRDVQLPAPADGEVLVRGLSSAISQGTELLLYRGEGPEPFDPSLDSAAATPTYPRRYGYAWVGAIVEGAGTRLVPGTRVFALAPHGAAHVLPANAVRTLRSDIPVARAALAANLETAITCVWDAEVALGERVVVLGAGVVGLLVAWLLQRSGVTVTLFDRRPKRRECARGLVPKATVLTEGAPDARADVVIEATGDPAVLDRAIGWAAPSARIIVASFYGRRRAAVDLGDAFHRRRLSIVASQVSTIPLRLGGRWDAARRFGLVEDLLGEPVLDGIVAPPVPFERAPELYAKLASDDGDVLPCHVFEYA